MSLASRTGARRALTRPVGAQTTFVRHNSGLNSLWSWFKRKDAVKKETAAPVIKTKDLVKNIEQQSKQGWSTESQAASELAKSEKAESGQEELKTLASATAVELEVIGTPKEPRGLSNAQLTAVGLNKGWKNAAVVTTWQQAEPMLAEIIGELSNNKADWKSVPLTSLADRLAVSKKFALKSGMEIPDLVLSTVHSAEGLANYLKWAIERNFNYWEPNAIHLNQKDFEGLNVIVRDAFEERKHRKELMEDLVAKADAFVETHDTQAFKQAIKQSA